MNMGLGQSVNLRQELEIVGGVTTTIFPEVERMLLSETDNQEALRFVAGRKSMERYRSMIDFLFCEVFLQYRYGCFKYYENESKNPLLKNILTQDEIDRYGRWLVAALELALEKFKQERVESWTRFRLDVLKLAA